MGAKFSFVNTQIETHMSSSDTLTLWSSTLMSAQSFEQTREGHYSQFARYKA